MIAMIGAIAAVVLFAVAGVWVWQAIDGYAITSAIVLDGPSNPLLKSMSAGSAVGSHAQVSAW
ncbi:MAG TPA: hypothetical protein VMF32_23980 [Xanthobacteraceae bacterium]|nr:hypothetical protein [Xanthobacteraceae bacterium]